jgi:TonB-dependent starch-binding outer membrane protein SusC
MKKNKRVPALRSRSIFKLLLLMKFTIALLLLTTWQASAKSYSQERITLKLQSAELRTALRQIEKKSSLRFLYNDQVISAHQKVDINANNALVTEILDGMLIETNLTYKVLENNLVVITQKDFLVQETKVAGKVTGPDGQAVPAVTVKIKGSNVATSTGSDGLYSITAPDGATLVFSSVGYETEEVIVGGRSEINISLKTSSKKLDDIVVIGYGTQRRKAVTGAISRITGDELSKQPVLTPIQGIQGLAPGIQVIGSSQPGTQPLVRIRGINGILTKADPLYVVDGVITDDIKNVNNSDVQSVDILKDGAAAIYGSRAANGVVLITTKRGRAGKAKINFNTSFGFRTLNNKVKLADRNLYLQYSHEALYYDSLANPTANNSTYLNTLDATSNTDWFKEINRKGPIQNYNLSVSGGTETVTYLFDVSYLNDKGIIKDADYDRVTLRLNNEYKLASFLKLGNVITAAISKSTNKPNGVFTDAYRSSPAAPVKTPDGNWGYQPGVSAVGNPVANIELTNDYSRDQRYQGSFYADLTIMKGLSFRNSWSFDRPTGDQVIYSPVYQFGPFQNTNSTLEKTNRERFYWTLENLINYTKSIDKHSIGATLGHTSEKDRSYSFKYRAKDVPNNRNLWYATQGNGTITFDPANELAFNLQRESYFGRLNYSYNDRYNVSGVLRRDASSAFPTGNKWGTFYSVGASWIISEESFLQGVKGIDYLKLRGSYAKLGNDEISRVTNNELSQLISVSTTDPYGFPSVLVTGFTYNKIRDALATWETTKATDIGLEFGLFSRKLTGEIAYYNKITNAYIRVPTPSFVDPDGTLQQAADVRNKGVELSLTWADKRTSGIGYRLGANATFNTNNVENVRGGIDVTEGGLGNGEITTRTTKGEPIGSFWLYQTDGIFQTQGDVEKYPHVTGTLPGDFKFIDTNGDGVIDARDRVYVGSYQPKFYYGLSGSVNWKQFDISIDCYGNAGNKVYNGKKAVRFGNESIEASRAGRWTASSASNTEPRASNSIPKPSTYFLESGSFFRVNNITIGYSLPTKTIEKAYLSSARIFFTAQNPIISKKFSGYSPELPGTNALNSGIELSVYPTTATYLFGISVSFK